MTWLHVVIYGMVQGITELFPVSSQAHSVILPQLVGWKSVTSRSVFLSILAIFHLSAGLALVAYFRHDWMQVISSLWKRKPMHRRLLGLIIVATVPATLVGLMVPQAVQIFSTPMFAGVFLVANGLVLAWADKAPRYTRNRRGPQPSSITYRHGVLIGLTQILVVIPGLSRPGIMMALCRRLGLSYETSAWFSFLLVTPVMLITGLCEAPQAMSAVSSGAGLAVIGGLIAGIVAFISTAYLMQYFKDHQKRAFRPFSWYCYALGVITVVFTMTSVHF